jgi:hypothetical protein
MQSEELPEEKNRVEIEQSATELLTKVRDQAEDCRGAVSQLRKDVQALKDAARTVEQSFSGSDFGYHSELYYRNFEKPPLGRQFNVEWGGVNGPQAGWEQKTADEVKARIETLSGVRVDKVEKDSADLVSSAKELGGELLIALAPLHSTQGLTKEKELLNQLEQFDWGQNAKNEYCLAAARSYPNMSRDSNAIMQGSRLPAHDYFEGIALQGAKSCEAVEGFWKISERLLRQLAQVEAQLPAQSDAMGVVRLICQRLHIVALQLAKRRANRQTLKIADEYDVQDLLHALLRLHFDDVRAEESTPSFGGGAARMDFLLKREQLVVEAKMTRSDLKDKEIADELIQDVIRYKSHPDCKKLVCIIYDPAGLLKNPTGLISDVEELSSDALVVEVHIAPKR